MPKPLNLRYQLTRYKNIDIPKTGDKVELIICCLFGIESLFNLTKVYFIINYCT